MSPIGEQLPSQALIQQWILSLGTEEPIHASSEHDELIRLRNNHANKKIQITMAPRVFDKCNQYKQERTKFDQMRPILASVSITTEYQPIKSMSTTVTVNDPLIENKLFLLPSDNNDLQDHLIDLA